MLITPRSCTGISPSSHQGSQYAPPQKQSLIIIDRWHRVTIPIQIQGRRRSADRRGRFEQKFLPNLLQSRLCKLDGTLLRVGEHLEKEGGVGSKVCNLYLSARRSEVLKVWFIGRSSCSRAMVVRGLVLWLVRTLGWKDGFCLWIFW